MRIVFMTFTWLLAAFPAAFAVNWELLTPDLKISGATITSVNKWTLLESFATLAECNDYRSSTIRQISKDRLELTRGNDPTVDVTERELRLLLEIYARSKCVQSR
jgi:hypothetical protein